MFLKPKDVEDIRLNGLTSPEATTRLRIIT
jgi:hypothetical protein